MRSNPNPSLVLFAMLAAGAAGVGCQSSHTKAHSTAGSHGTSSTGSTGTTGSGSTGSTSSTGSTGSIGSSSSGSTGGTTGEVLVTIQSPSEGAAVNIGEAISFACTAIGPIGSALPNADLQWSSNVEGNLPAGGHVNASLSQPGPQSLTCTATDPTTQRQGSAVVHLTVNPNHAPVVTITSPANGAYVKVNSQSTFTGTATDVEQGNLTSSLQWLVNGSTFGGGGTATYTFTATGDYTVTARATDAWNAVGTASIVVHAVNNLPPVCTITSPPNNSIYYVTQNQLFSATCFDPDGPNPTTPLPGASMTWSSSLQGALFTGASRSGAILTQIGSHVITVSVPDPVDPALVGSASVNVELRANRPPTSCAISASPNGTVVPVGTRLSLAGSATDLDTPGQLVLSWGATPALNFNPSASGTNVSATLSTAGTYTLTMTATDPGFLSCQATLIVTADNPPSVSLTSSTQVQSGGGSFECTTQSCRAGTGANDVIVAGSAGDGEAFTTSWQDSILGAVGAPASFNAGTFPLQATVSALVGKHVTSLTATDVNGLSATATRTFTIHPATGGPLFTGVSGANGVSVASTSVAADGSISFVTANSRQVYDIPAGSSIATSRFYDIGDVWNVVQVDSVQGAPTAALGSDGSGFAICALNGGMVDPNFCTSYQGGDLPSDRIHSILMIPSLNTLIVGTRNGLLVTYLLNPGSNGGNATGLPLLDGMGHDITALAFDPDTDIVYAGGSHGIHEIQLSSAPLTSNNPGSIGASVLPTSFHQPDLPSNQVNGLWLAPVNAPKPLFAATDNGLAEIASNAVVQTWDITQPPLSLGASRINAVTGEQQEIPPGSANLHTVVFAATDGSGVIRLDAAIGSLSDFTTTDGLLSNTVLSAAVTPNATPGLPGAKWFGTANGLSRYDGY